MIRRICRQCGSEIAKELTPEGPRFFCESCDGDPPYDEFEMDPHCPECVGKLQVFTKCAQGFFCSQCKGLVSSKKIIWKEK